MKKFVSSDRIVSMEFLADFIIHSIIHIKSHHMLMINSILFRVRMSVIWNYKWIVWTYVIQAISKLNQIFLKSILTNTISKSYQNINVIKMNQVASQTLMSKATLINNVKIRNDLTLTQIKNFKKSNLSKEKIKSNSKRKENSMKFSNKLLLIQSPINFILKHCLNFTKKGISRNIKDRK